MNLDHLLRQRSALRRQTRLADIAYVYEELGTFADRIARANLRGRVTLHLADPTAERVWPILVAEEGSQAVVDEHFIDRDVLDLADLLLFVVAPERPEAFTFRCEDFSQRFRRGLRRELEAAGIALPPETPDRTRLSGA